jgi:hypothetical protein
VQVPSLTKGEVWEYETTEYNLELKFTDISKVYWILVCSENWLGRICSSPERLHVVKSKTDANISPKRVGLEESPSTKELLSFPVVISIAVVIPVVLLVLCIAAIGVVIMCKCCGTSKEYYPSRQGSPKGIIHCMGL